MDPLHERAERKLGAIGVAIEFTLISVMVGVMLFPLMESAVPVLRRLEFEYWLYILSGLLLILLLWTLVISHALTFVGWPVDLGHNLLYIALSLVMGIQMHFIAEPLAWWVLDAAGSAVVALVMWHDRNIIKTRLDAARGATIPLYRTAFATQGVLLQSIPLVFGFSVLSAMLIWFIPTFFLDLKGHVVLIAIQVAFTMMGLRYALQLFRNSTPAILDKEIQALERADD